MPAAVIELRPKQQRFVHEYLVDQNATQAAIRAGYSEKTANVQACQLLIKLNAIIDPMLKAQQAAQAETCGITRERWLQEILRCAFTDAGKFYDVHGNPIEIPLLDEDSRRAVIGFEFTEDFVRVKDDVGEQKIAAGYTKKIKLADKLKALELFGKATGHYVEKRELSGTLTLAQLLDAANGDTP